MSKHLYQFRYVPSGGADKYDCLAIGQVLGEAWGYSDDDAAEELARGLDRASRLALLAGHWQVTEMEGQGNE